MSTFEEVVSDVAGALPEIAKKYSAEATTQGQAKSIEEYRRKVDKIFEILTPQQQTIIRRKYGFDCEPQTVEQIGSELCVPRTRVRTMKASALKTLLKKGITEDMVIEDNVLVRYIGKKRNVVIPEGVTHISSIAFGRWYCKSLKSLIIPASVTEVGISEFTDSTCGLCECWKLERITVDENNTVYKSIDGNLYTKDGKILIQYALGKNDMSFVIPTSVTTIGACSFYSCRSLTSVTIPNSVTSIGKAAFMDCNRLSSVNIPHSITSIGAHAFCLCWGLENITVDENNMAYQSIDGNLYTKDGKTLVQYALGKDATSFVIPRGVTDIGDYALYGVSKLASVAIPDSITKIGKCAFSCYMTTVHIEGEEKKHSGLETVRLPRAAENPETEEMKKFVEMIDKALSDEVERVYDLD